VLKDSSNGILGARKMNDIRRVQVDLGFVFARRTERRITRQSSKYMDKQPSKREDEVLGFKGGCKMISQQQAF
jgi:hypothetical protein